MGVSVDGRLGVSVDRRLSVSGDRGSHAACMGCTVTARAVLLTSDLCAEPWAVVLTPVTWVAGLGPGHVRRLFQHFDWSARW